MTKELDNEDWALIDEALECAERVMRETTRHFGISPDGAFKLTNRADGFRATRSKVQSVMKAKKKEGETKDA